MGQPPKIILTVDYSDAGRPRVLSATVAGERYELKGECRRCGRCCRLQPCRHLTRDGDRYACGLGWLFPFGCRVYPLPFERPLDGCGLSYMKT